MVVNFIPDFTPGGGTYARVAFMNLNSAIFNQDIPNTHDRRPECRFGSIVSSTKSLNLDDIWI